jgi:hypothetical protein
MSNITIAAEIISGLLSVTINALQSAQVYQVLIERARAEGREISDSELKALRGKSLELTTELLSKLE